MPVTAIPARISACLAESAPEAFNRGLRVVVLLALLCVSWGCSKPLEKRLLAPNLTTRQKALKELDAASPGVKERMAKAMIEAFKAPVGSYDEEFSHWAGAALGKVGKPGVPVLLRAMREERRYIRANVILALGQIGPDAGAAVPALIEISRDKKADEPGFPMREYAVQSLGEIGPVTPEVIPALLEALTDSDSQADSDSQIANYAGQVLVFRSPMVEAAVPVIIREIDQGRLSRAQYSWILFRPTSKKAVPQLIAALEHENSRVRVWATYAFSDLKSEAVVAVPAIAKRIFDSDEEVRRSALITLGRLGPDAAVAVPELQLALKSSHVPDRSLAAEALGLIGPGTKSALPALRSVLADSDQSVRTSAAMAMKAIGAEPHEGMEALIQALKSGNSSSRFSVALTLGKMGPDAAPAVPHLIALLQDPVTEEYVWQVVVQALGQIGPAAKEAVPILLKAADSKGVKSGVIVALGKIDSPTENVVDFLVKNLRDPRSHNRVESAKALGRFGSKAAPAASELANLFARTPHDYEKAAAAESLGKIGPGAKEAVSVLLQTLENEKYNQIRSTVTIALERIGGASAIEIAGRQNRVTPRKRTLFGFLTIGLAAYWAGVLCLLVSPLVILVILWFQRKMFKTSTPVLAALCLSTLPTILGLVFLCRLFSGNWLDDPGIGMWIFRYLPQGSNIIVGAMIVLILLEGARTIQTFQKSEWMQFVRLVAFTLPTTIPILGWSGNIPAQMVLSLLFLLSVAAYVGLALPRVVSHRTKEDFLAFLSSIGVLAGLFLSWSVGAFFSFGRF